MNRIYWDIDKIASLTDHLEAATHSHGMIQFFLFLHGTPEMKVGKDKIHDRCLFVNVNVKHAVKFSDGLLFTCVIEPASDMGRKLSALLAGKEYFALEDKKADELIALARSLTSVFSKESYTKLMQKLYEVIGAGSSEKKLDERITAFLSMLENCSCTDHSIDHFAEELHLSSSRLSHLFSEQVGITLKDYLLLHQLERVFQDILSGRKITDAAMDAGFDSPSHFASTVKRLMGLPARSTIKDSEFLKVY